MGKSITEVLVKVHNDADLVKKLQSESNKEDSKHKEIGYMILTSVMPCEAIQKHYDTIGGWE